MNTARTITATILIITTLYAGLTCSEELNSDDPIVASFERELNREPTPARPVQRNAISQDELYAVLNSVHWSSPEQLVKVLSTCQAEANQEEGKGRGQRSAYIARCVTLAAR